MQQHEDDGKKDPIEQGKENDILSVRGKVQFWKLCAEETCTGFWKLFGFFNETAGVQPL